MEPAPDINRGKEFLDKAKEIHAKYPLFDGHNGEEIDGKGGDRSQESPVPSCIVDWLGGTTAAIMYTPVSPLFHTRLQHPQHPQIYPGLFEMVST